MPASLSFGKSPGSSFLLRNPGPTPTWSELFEVESNSSDMLCLFSFFPQFVTEFEIVLACLSRWTPAENLVALRPWRPSLTGQIYTNVWPSLEKIWHGREQVIAIASEQKPAGSIPVCLCGWEKWVGVTFFLPSTSFSHSFTWIRSLPVCRWWARYPAVC